MGIDSEPNRAADTLRRAAEMTTQLRLVAVRRVRGYLIGWSVASLALVPAIGLLGRLGAAVGLGIWTAVVLIGVGWFRRGGAFAAAGSAHVKRGAAGWAVIYAVVIAVGSGGHVTDVWFWVIGGLATAMPLVVAATRCARTIEPSAAAA